MVTAKITRKGKRTTVKIKYDGNEYVQVWEKMPGHSTLVEGRSFEDIEGLLSEEADELEQIANSMRHLLNARD